MTEKYLPHFEDGHGNTWDMLQINICIDFGGRQAQIEFQRNNDDGTYPVKTFVYYYNTDEFTQWDSEECEDIEINMAEFRKSAMYKAIRPLFSEFGEPFNG